MLTDVGSFKRMHSRRITKISLNHVFPGLLHMNFIQEANFNLEYLDYRAERPNKGKYYIRMAALAKLRPEDIVKIKIVIEIVGQAKMRNKNIWVPRGFEMAIRRKFKKSEETTILLHDWIIYVIMCYGYNQIFSCPIWLPCNFCPLSKDYSSLFLPVPALLMK